MDGKCFLLTTAGTLVYFDPSTHALCHGPLAASPRNARLEDAAQGAARLALLGEGGAGCRTLDVRRAASRGGLAVVAERAEEAGEGAQWGCLLPVSQEQLDLLAALLGSGWFRARSGCVIPRSAVSLGEGFRLAVGDMVLHLDAAVFPVVAQEEAGVDGQRVLRSVDVLHDRWKLERLEMFSPLVYMTVFGAESFFRSAALTIASLERVGGYTGDYLFVTDASPEACRACFGDVAPERVRVLHRPASTFSDMVAERLKVDRAATGFHQPLLYLDSDVICDAPIQRMLVDIMAYGRALFATEFVGHSFQQVADNAADWFGRFLAREDLHWDLRLARCLNTGIFGARNADILAGPFRTALAVWQAYREEHDIAAMGMDFEQPFVSYALQKTRAVDLAVLDCYAICVYGHDPREHDVGRGLVHFNSGVGVDKFARMRAYLSHLLPASSVESKVEALPQTPPKAGLWNPLLK